MGTSLRDLQYLLEKVLRCERVDAGKHIRYYFKVNGRVVAQTHYSHSWRGNTQIDNSMVSMQAREMRCSTKTWRLLLEGKVSKEAYFQELFQSGHISQEEFDDLRKKR